MNADIFAEWLRRQGYRVVRSTSSYWYEANSHVYQAFPYHWTIEPSEEDLRRLLEPRHAIALRYSAPVAAPQGKVSYHIVCSGDYKLESLPRQTRQNILKGLNYASIEPISLARLATEGWRLRLDTLARQGRTGAESENWWRRTCASAEALPGFEAWGAIHAGALVSACLAFVCDDCYTVPFQQSASAHLEGRINNAIFYSVTSQALQRPGISRVFFCLQSLDAPCSVDEFKLRMGFSAQPVRQRVVFHPWLIPLVNNSSHALVKQLVVRFPGITQLAKAEGMLRFHLEGRRPPAQQHWPEGLLSRRAELLATLS